MKIIQSTLNLLMMVCLVMPVAAQEYTAATIMDPVTGQILFDYNAHEMRPIASMTKMMTLLIVLEQIESGNLSWDTPVETSAKASNMGGSQVYLKHREVFPVRDLVAATMVHSANDAAMALAEKVAGNDASFVRMMNEKAKELGLKETEFHSPHGLPARGEEKDDMMSPHDLAILGTELMKHESMQKLAVTQQMPFRGGEFTMYNPNHLLRNYPLATGIKTGYHGKAGFCVTASAKKGDMELVGVVVGSPDKKANFGSAARLFDTAFATFERVEPVTEGKALAETVPVSGGTISEVGVIPGKSVLLTVNKNKRPKLDVSVNATSATAPIAKGEQIGWIIVKRDGAPFAKVPALAASAVEESGWLSRTWNKIWPFD